MGEGGEENEDVSFRFLTMEEFNRLDRREKITYLARATDEILRMKGDPTVQSLFKDQPPLPGLGLPEKPA
jgi:hypothetical protein